MTEVLIAIDDSSIRIRVKGNPEWNGQTTIEIHGVGFLPVEVTAWIHVIQRKFGEPEEIT